MKPTAPPRGHCSRGKATALLVAALSLALAGCNGVTDFDDFFDTDSAPSSVTVEPINAVQDDPILATVAQARQFNIPFRVVDPQDGVAYLITVEAEYHSASDRRCRRYVAAVEGVTTRTTPQFACDYSGIWKAITLN